MKNRIKDVLKEKGITQKELAEKIGMTEVGLSKAINGNTTNSTVSKIAKALNVSNEDLIVREKVLKAKYGSDKTPLHLGSLELPCYVLEDGTRVFSGRGVQSALGASPNSSGTWLSKFVNSKAIVMCLHPETLDKLNNPIKFERPSSSGSQSNTYGYEVTLLIDLCNAIIDADRSRELSINETYVKNANIIIRSVAKVGIVALVDEVTGYNKDKNRAKDELQQFLANFMSQEASRWVKTFDDNFFEMIYKMRGWSWTITSQRPGIVGTWINDIVYERLAPQVFTELKKKNPKNENGNRPYRYHQFLSEEIGHPRLREHISGVMAIGRISNNNWPTFMHNLDKAYPKQYQQLDFDFVPYEEITK
ncbi:P63C domain-containing protein [uncultured Bacteroides sp.]|uniref:P63C domain-containing protein n=1 Tax=uncultured Bacteroides sp. TaxID=162156 RepID=UPI002AABF909|nr:P63C domain-containing protein [uncultured Bacteroides sp.]